MRRRPSDDHGATSQPAPSAGALRPFGSGVAPTRSPSHRVADHGKFCRRSVDGRRLRRKNEVGQPAGLVASN